MLHRIQGRLSKCRKDLAPVLARIPGMLDQEDRDKLVLHVDVHIGAVGPTVTKSASALKRSAIWRPPASRAESQKA